MNSSLVSTDWTVAQNRARKFEVSTSISRESEKGSERVDIRVIIDGADKLTGRETHRAALLTARNIINTALGDPIQK